MHSVLEPCWLTGTEFETHRAKAFGAVENRYRLPRKPEKNRVIHKFLAIPSSAPPYPQKPTAAPLTLPLRLLKVCT